MNNSMSEYGLNFGKIENPHNSNNIGFSTRNCDYITTKQKMPFNGLSLTHSMANRANSLSSSSSSLSNGSPSIISSSINHFRATNHHHLSSPQNQSACKHQQQLYNDSSSGKSFNGTEQQTVS